MFCPDTAADADWENIREQIAAEIDTLTAAVKECSADEVAAFLSRYGFEINWLAPGEVAIEHGGYRWQHTQPTWFRAVTDVLSTLCETYSINALLAELSAEKSRRRN